MENNPYSAPASNLFESASATGSEGVTPTAVAHLQKTKPWVQFLAILLFIMAGLMILGGALTAVGGGIGAMATGGENAAFAAGTMVGVAIFYALLGLLYLYPAIKMWKYGNRIADLVTSRRAADLEAALNEQRVVWKFWGVITIISIIGAIGFAAVAGVAGVMSMKAAASAGAEP